MPRKQAKTGQSSAGGLKRDKTTGRFVKGTKPPPGPGRPKGYSDAFRAACTPDDLGEIVDSLVEFAKAGDVRAASEILKRLVPEKLSVEHTGEAAGAIVVVFDPGVKGGDE